MKVEIKKEDFKQDIKEEPVEFYEFETKEELAEMGENVGSAGSKNASASKKHECSVCGKQHSSNIRATFEDSHWRKTFQV